MVVRHGALLIQCVRCSLTHAVSLLRTLIGERIDRDPDGAAEFARRCGRLPLLLRKAAEVAHAHPQLPLAQVAGSGHRDR